MIFPLKIKGVVRKVVIQSVRNRERVCDFGQADEGLEHVCIAFATHPSA